MKRLVPLVIFLLGGLLLATFGDSISAQMQELRQQLGSRQENKQSQINADPLPRSFLNQNRLHKLILKREQSYVYEQLVRVQAIRQEVNYGSFKLVVVDETALGGRATLQSLPVAPHDEQNLIGFNGYVLDTSNAQPLSTALPSGLQLSRLADARSRNAWPSGGLFVVQFVGPTQDAWLDALRAQGLRVISYVPHNAFVVQADARAAAALLQLPVDKPFVQWVGDYEPAYKLTPTLRAQRATNGNELVKITVQAIAGTEGEQALETVRRVARQVNGERRVLQYRNLTATVPVAQLAELASLDGVFAIEEAGELVRLDEAQGQIVAGALNGDAPRGPGYLNWLRSRGFNETQFGTFSVEVVDDAYTLAGHPDLLDNRIAFQNNITNQVGLQGGHGFLNAHIIGGLNDRTDSESVDANGFRYGLGIAPWARIGTTAIFGRGFATPTSWEAQAYENGARISNNSWGKIDERGKPIVRYDSWSQDYDRMTRDVLTTVPGNQELTFVFAAGNSGPGLNTTAAPSTAKNIITVGASENVRQTGSDGCGVQNASADNANDLAKFSSRGPVDPYGGDGRFKPDLVAPGTHVQAGIPQNNYAGNTVCNKYWPGISTLYGWSSGTSHAAPAVAGGAALVYQHFLNQNLKAPSPAMIKAFLMNSATHMTGSEANDTLPSSNQGMGRLDLGRAFDGVPRVVVDQSELLTETGQVFRVSGSVVRSDQPFRVTLAWSDAPGAIVGSPVVNDLHLEVTINGQTYKGNVFSGATSIPNGIADNKNNIESVFLPAGISGSFTVTVTAANLTGDGVPNIGGPTDQDFALVVYNGSKTPPPVVTLNPTSLNFTATLGGATPAAQTINLTNTGGGALTWSATDDATWLSVTPGNGAAPATLTASVNLAGLNAGTYRATITLLGNGAANSPLSIPVTLTVNRLSLSVSPASLTFNAVLGSNPANQTLNITGVGSGVLNWTASDNAAWLTVSPANGTAPATLTAAVNTNGLAAGTYNATLTVSAAGAANSPVTIPVSLTIRGPALNVAPSSLNFSGALGGNNPAPQTLSLLNTGAGTLNWTASENATWLALSPTSGTAPATLTASVNLNGLPVGTYNTTITITAANATGSPVSIPVSLIVRGPTLSVSPASLSFAGILGSGNPANQTLNVANIGAGSLNWTASENAAWLSLTPASGAAPGTITVAVNLNGLAVGTYNTTIAVTANAADNSPASIPVSLTVRGPALAVAPSALGFTAIVGAANPSAQTLNITNTGVGTLNWTASDNAAWLTVSPGSGTAPAAPAVSINSNGLAAGTYTAAITITANSATGSPLTIPVTLTVNGPVLSVNPTALTFIAAAGGNNPLAQTLSISNQGAGALVWSASADAPWLSVGPPNGTAPSTLTAGVNINGLAVGTYNGNLTVTANGATGSPLKIPVRLIVNPPGGTELLLNGGFEGTDEPWQFVGEAYHTLYDNYPRSGYGYIYLGVSNDVTGAAYQLLKLPEGTSPVLKFWLNVSSSEQTNVEKDRLFVEVRSLAGELLTTLATFSNLNKTTAGNYSLQGNFSLTRFAGQTVRLQFRVITDAALNTTFRIDDVSVK